MIHILTFHRAINYGAVLQCYALFSTISNIKNCDVIDYDGRSKLKKSLTEIVKSVLVANRMRIKKQKFEEFIGKNINLSRKFNSCKDLQAYPWSEADAFCVGSDQVWNWNLTNEDDTYLLTFAPKGTCKFSYAASIGCELDPEHIRKLRQSLRGFSGISVRETSACSVLQRNGIECHQDIDPVFLLQREQWEQVSTAVPHEDTPYVLVYLLRKAPDLLQAAAAYAKKKHLRVVYISTGVKRDIKAEYAVQCGPDEFIRYFLKADTVFTNSFHGVSFSILFNKLFYFELLRNGPLTNNRLNDIVRIFHLEEQNISCGKMDGTPIDYQGVNAIIAKKREEAISYLTRQVLEGADDRQGEKDSTHRQGI